MAEDVTYYAVIVAGHTPQDASGLARRRHIETGGFVDEALTQSLTWSHTSAIVEWKRDAMDFTLVEIGEDEARGLIERFRERWGAQESNSSQHRP